MINIVVLIFIVIIILLIMSRLGGKINIYFANALRLYLLYGYEDARLAVLSAARTASSEQRKDMINYLTKTWEIISQLIDKLNKKDEKNWCIEFFLPKINGLKNEILLKDWSNLDSIEIRKELKKANIEYLKALRRSNPLVFEKRYPWIFKRKCTFVDIKEDVIGMFEGRDEEQKFLMEAAMAIIKVHPELLD